MLALQCTLQLSWTDSACSFLACSRCQTPGARLTCLPHSLSMEEVISKDCTRWNNWKDTHVCPYSCKALMKAMEMLQHEKQCIQKYREPEKLPGIAFQGPWLVTQDSSPHYERPTYEEGISVSEDLVFVLVEDIPEISRQLAHCLTHYGTLC